MPLDPAVQLVLRVSEVSRVILAPWVLKVTQVQWDPRDPRDTREIRELRASQASRVIQGQQV